MLQTQRTNVTDAAEIGGGGLGVVESRFAGLIATAVWIGNLTDEAAREALLSYALACQLCKRANASWLKEALLAEYRHCRERQDLCS